MIPLIETASLGGIPITSLLSSDQLMQVTDFTRDAGTEIVKHLRNRSGFYAAGNIIAEIIDSVVSDRKRIFSLDVSLDTVPELDGICLSLPAIVGIRGVESVVLPKLSDNKLASLQKLSDFVVDHLN